MIDYILKIAAWQYSAMMQLGVKRAVFVSKKHAVCMCMCSLRGIIRSSYVLEG